MGINSAHMYIYALINYIVAAVTGVAEPSRHLHWDMDK